MNTNNNIRRDIETAKNTIIVIGMTVFFAVVGIATVVLLPQDSAMNSHITFETSADFRPHHVYGIKEHYMQGDTLWLVLPCGTSYSVPNAKVTYVNKCDISFDRTSIYVKYIVLQSL